MFNICKKDSMYGFSAFFYEFAELRAAAFGRFLYNFLKNILS